MCLRAYGVPFSHLFPELQIYPMELQISPDRPNWRYLQLNWRHLQIGLFGDIGN